MDIRTGRTALLRIAMVVSACVAAALPPIAAPAAAAPAAPAAPAPRTPAAPPPARDATRAELDRVIRQTAADAGVPGVIVGIWEPGKPRYVRAFGVADTSDCEPMRTDLNMRIGSETKTFTVTALLQLVDRGEVGLDDPISAYVDGVPDGDHITLRQLADMRSGLFAYTKDAGFQHLLATEPHRQWVPSELLDIAFSHPNQFPPGTQFDYSNTNTVLLGLVVEKVAHRPLSEVIRDRITRPSRLDHTFLPEAAEFPQPHAHGYTDLTPDGTVADATDFNPSWGWAAGAMISDLDDMRSWAESVATGRLLSPQTQAERLDAHPTGAPGDFYGLGIDINHGWIGHAGSLPGYQSLTVYLPARKTTMVILLNTDIPSNDENPSTLLGRAITQIISPDNVYGDASDQN
ncbi:serine hydrolase [Streptomyces sp. TLI_171]|uniref:serine hydrolase domain-containing protein n=1 Tax=Streptomyces sp. TLI_171 TaxID=1938859 RepID=UPI00217EAB31|nr:serine hydrolase domain-containing protein [Streptomyces sp. TLI_171]